MTDIDNLAAALFGSKRAETQEVLTDATTRTYMGTALTDSEGGTVMVDLGGDVTLPDDIDGLAEYSSEGVEVATGPGVRAGDEVIVTLVGGTSLKTPMVTGVAGEGDDQDARIAAASAAAEAAWDWADEAHDAATDAQASADAAQDAAESAASSAGSAASSASSAASAAQQAVSDASAASQAAGEAQASAQQARSDAADAADAAQAAGTAAQQAVSEAALAAQSASAAQDSAEDANRAANGALAGLGTLESVVDTVEWFAEHKKATTDTTVQSGKTYYEYDESTGTLSKVEPDGTENPSQQGWYELDETIQNYVSTHVATTDDGLYVTALAGGWRILVSAGAGDYVAGVFLVDPQGNIAQATTGSGITFDDSKPFHIGDEDAFIVFDGNGGIQMGGAITLGQYGTLSQLLSAVGSSISAVEYGVGSSPTSHSDITSWSSASPTWQEGKYVWMRTTTNGQTYTYTCIQGARGEDGDEGSQILGITTAPSSYTTTTGGFTPTYRIALSTVRTQSGATEVRVGDVLAYSYYHYPVGYVDSSYAYCGARKSIRGAAGSGVTVSSVEYGTSASASTAPSSWSTTVPTSIANGQWLWARTNYSDGTNAVTKSYAGTDGEDGTSVFVQSATKTGDTTTVVIADSEGHTSTLTIKDGEDGQNGTNGTNGLTGYVHTAWANSADGMTDFSTTVSANKRYLGVYTDNTATDSTTPGSYSWSLIKGADGTSVTVSRVEYGTSTSASTQPSSWSTSVPTSIANGLWLWAKTTYSDSTTAITKSYVGTDGTDGKSVYVQSSSKSGDTTTVVLTDGTTSTTLTIKDGEDGAAGTAGASGYVHTAWANSANGATDFSTTVSANKTYLGVYTDNTAADSQRYQDYSWSLIKGADGTSVTVSSTATSYVSSTSGTTIPTSGWQSTVPSVAQGSYLWTRVVTTFSDSKTATSYTASRQGANGTNGTNGISVTVSSTAYAYQLSTSGTSVPTGTWQTTPQAPTTTQYAWTRTTTTYSDGSTSVTYTVGGKAGTNGTSYYTHIRYATNSSGANMSATPSASTTYIGVYSGTSSTAPTSASSYTWSKYVGDKGDVGDTGPEAVVTVYPSAIDWDAGTATLAVTLRVDGTVTAPSSYKWTKGTATTSLGTAATLAVSDLNATYNCTVTW